jgi:ABC-2 type transport system ATP-binding protein
MDGRIDLTSPIGAAARIPRESASVWPSVSIAPQPLLEVTGLKKHYGDQIALADVSFLVNAGEVLGVIGPNGAGKTTLLEVIAGLLPADSGVIAFHGSPLPQGRRREAMFYVPDGIRPYQEQPVARVLAFFAGIYGKSSADTADVIAKFGLESSLNKRVRSLSKGYARRLALTLGLLAPHPVLLMDEPFDGFDLRQTREIAHVLRE